MLSGPEGAQGHAGFFSPLVGFVGLMGRLLPSSLLMGYIFLLSFYWLLLFTYIEATVLLLIMVSAPLGLQRARGFDFDLTRIY